MWTLLGDLVVLFVAVTAAIWVLWGLAWVFLSLLGVGVGILEKLFPPEPYTPPPVDWAKFWREWGAK